MISNSEITFWVTSNSGLWFDKNYQEYIKEGVNNNALLPHKPSKIHRARVISTQNNNAITFQIVASRITWFFGNLWQNAKKGPLCVLQVCNLKHVLCFFSLDFTFQVYCTVSSQTGFSLFTPSLYILLLFCTVTFRFWMLGADTFPKQKFEQPNSKKSCFFTKPNSFGNLFFFLRTKLFTFH